MYNLEPYPKHVFPERELETKHDQLLPVIINQLLNYLSPYLLGLAS
jgi:hypothetical protein